MASKEKISQKRQKPARAFSRRNPEFGEPRVTSLPCIGPTLVRAPASPPGLVFTWRFLLSPCLQETSSRDCGPPSTPNFSSAHTLSSSANMLGRGHRKAGLGVKASGKYRDLLPHTPHPRPASPNLPLGFLGLGHGKAERSVAEVGALKITGRPETGLSSGGPVEPQVYFRIYFIFHSVSA